MRHTQKIASQVLIAFGPIDVHLPPESVQRSKGNDWTPGHSPALDCSEDNRNDKGAEGQPGAANRKAPELPPLIPAAEVGQASQGCARPEEAATCTSREHVLFGQRI